MKTRTALASTGLMVMGALAACAPAGPPPCSTLPPPTQQEQDIARSGVELEREVGGAECVIVGDRWVDQTDDV